MTLIIENKPNHQDVREDQLSPNRGSFAYEIDDDTLHGSAVCLEWPEVLEGVLKYVNSDLASFGSREIARDFLSFVEEYHPKLTPYSTFGLCGEKPEALQRRTSVIVDDLARQRGLGSRWDKKDKYLYRPDKIAERVMIQVKSQRLKVGLAPADTVEQARHFYRHFYNNAVDKESFLSLKEWKVKPNLHFSFMGTNLVWAETALGTREYFDHFSESSSYGQRSADRDTLSRLACQWEHEGLISSADRKKIEDEFINTNRKTINIVPGFSVTREWDLSAVIKLEEQGKLEECIIDALATPLATWGKKHCRGNRRRLDQPCRYVPAAASRRSVRANSMIFDRSRRTLVIQSQRRQHLLPHRCSQLLRLQHLSRRPETQHPTLDLVEPPARSRSTTRPSSSFSSLWLGC